MDASGAERVREWLGMMLRHMEWADATVIESLRRQGGSPKAVGIMGHVVAAERLWLSRVQGTAAGAIAVWPKLTLDECLRVGAENAKAIARILETAGEPELSCLTAYVNSKGERFESRLDDILLHVFLHGSYHRGQIALLQRTDGREPTLTDYIHYRRAIHGVA